MAVSEYGCVEFLQEVRESFLSQRIENVPLHTPSPIGEFNRLFSTGIPKMSFS